ncbi:MAG: TolC family protein [Gemmatimonadaceae bacterium]|nr:TolC family protein [Gemmatimonadaceae bacterium]
MHSAWTGIARRAVLALLLPALLPQHARAQQPVPATRPLTLDDAFRLAEPASDDVRLAQNAVTRAKGQYFQTRATVLPQLSATANYQHQIQNQFAAITKRFAQPTDPTAPPDTTTAAVNPIGLLFASPNTITFGLQASQPLYVDGRFKVATRVAKANEDVSRYGLRTARAKLRYDIAAAYFDAVITEKLVQIAESSLVQVQRTLQQTTLQRQVGTVAEYDLLRSRVAVDAQRPLLIRAQQNRDIATLNLKQLLNLPLTTRLDLTTPIQDADMDRVLATSQLDTDVRPSAGTGLSAAGAQVLPKLGPRDTAPEARSAVQQAAAALEVQKGALRNAQLARVPVLNLASNYSRAAYPSNSDIIPRTLADFYPAWTVSLGFTLPIWTSGRIKGDQMVARANVADAEARLSQGRRAAALDVQLALKSLEQAEANWLASIGTEDQADKALRIAEVRYSNGISTQLELSDIRNLLIQSQANRLTAARDLQLARLRMTLLRDLPLGSGGGTASATGQQP